MNAYHIFLLSVLILQQVCTWEYDAVSHDPISTFENLLADFHRLGMYVMPLKTTPTTYGSLLYNQ